MIGVRLLPSRVSRVVSSAVISSIALAMVALVGCGGAAAEAGAPAAKSPEAVGTREPGSIDEAQAQIAAAQAQLGGGAGMGSSESTSSVPGATPSPSPAAPRSPSTSPAPPAADAARSITENRCGSPCRALASMRRAVAALCRMTGNEDTRCSDAKRTLVESEGRVAPCSC
jgi:hypothetical protein